MLSTRSGRAASVLAAAALVGGGLFATMPAYADDATPTDPPASTETPAPADPAAPETPEAAAPTFTATPTSFTLGAWNGTDFGPVSLGDGLSIAGTGFAASTAVTVTLTGSYDGVEITTEATTVTTDDTGAFDTTWIPEHGLSSGLSYAVTAADGTTTADAVDLTVLAPAGAVAIPSTLTTQQLHDTGVIVIAGGFTPGEVVTVTSTYAGAVETHSGTANVNGAVAYGESWYGTLPAGTISYTLTGADSGHVETTTVTVTGDTVTTDPGLPTPKGKVTPTTPNLPKVSG
ncbi:hypothetical protein [Leifsonia sp. NPDC080035]|uniref:Bacterial Ig-like domain-containing protein n=1 Tax=Leifsonia sp. NPDC080035 TaxID=3143936 RepID=A0AAU7G9P4_9MICO